MIAHYGADSLRLYEMFMGPLDAVKPWAESGVKGVFNFLARVFRFFSEKDNVVDGLQDDSEVVKELNKTIKKVADDIEGLRFNTAISQMMIFTNACSTTPTSLSGWFFPGCKRATLNFSATGCGRRHTRWVKWRIPVCARKKTRSSSP